MALNLPNLYFRWTRQGDDRIKADILLPGVYIDYDVVSGVVRAAIGRNASVDLVELDPDTARMIGVRLIEAASRAENDRKTRQA